MALLHHTLEAISISQCQGAARGGRVLFEELSFQWESPSVHVVMGSSGAGKSTFLKSIGGVWRPRSGRVLFDGQDLWDAAGAQNIGLLRQLGFAFQNNALFNSMRVLENLLYAHRQRARELPEPDRRALGLDWLKKVGLEASAEVYPHELSGGMQKRLSIARALMLEPSFLFLDDPTAGLDPITSRTIAKMLHELLEGREMLVVIVTNDPDRAREWGAPHFLSGKKLHSPDSQDYRSVREVFL